MTVTSAEYAHAAKDAYRDRPNAVVDSEVVTLHGHSYTAFAYESFASGLHATAYRQVDPPGGLVRSSAEAFAAPEPAPAEAPPMVVPAIVHATVR